MLEDAARAPSDETDHGPRAAEDVAGGEAQDLPDPDAANPGSSRKNQAEFIEAVAGAALEAAQAAGGSVTSTA